MAPQPLISPGPFACPRFVTLYPGDIILTGTPPGVGVFRKPPVFLKVGWPKEGTGPRDLTGMAQAGEAQACVCMCRFVCVRLRSDNLATTPLQKGDEVQCEIEELGVLINKVV